MFSNNVQTLSNIHTYTGHKKLDVQSGSPTRNNRNSFFEKNNDVVYFVIKLKFW